MAGPARTITPLPRRNASSSPAKTLADLGGSSRMNVERDMILAKALDGKLNNTGTLTLATGGATTTDIDDPRIGPNTIAVLQGIDQNGAASITTISQSVVQPGKIRLTHAASALTRTIGFVLFGILMLTGAAWAQSPTLVGIPQSSDPTCNAGEYYLAVLSTGSKWRKCENGVWSDIGAAAGAGEANTASNLGGGLANFDSKSGVDLRFNSFNASHFDIAANVLSADEPGLESLLDLADLNGLLPLAKMTDDATSGKCLLSGGGGGDPAYGTCPGGGTATELDQSAGETDLRYDATFEAYYYDVDGDGTRDADGTERFADTYVIEVPGDYASVQAALDSDDCKKGSNTLNQGCAIRVAPGTYAEKFEISDASVTANQQNSILIEGVAPMGWENSLSNPICAVTFTGDGTANHTVVDIEDAGGIIIRNFCIDMDTAAANDPKYGIAIGQSTASATVNKHIVVENITVFDPGASGGAAIRLGNGGGTNSDAAFITLRNLFLSEVRTCIEVDAQQAVSNAIDNVQCSNPSATIGGISIGSSGGELKIKNFYMSTDAAISNQIGINVRNEAVGAIDINGCTFEWDGDDGTMINFENPGTNTGAFRASNISRCRFVIQDIPTTAHKCIDYNRKGVINIEGNSFESTNASMTCEIDFNNPDSTKIATMNYRANDVQWNATQSPMVINETSSGGALVLNKQEFGTHWIGEDGSLTFEGATLDGSETTLTVTDPTADRTVTFPDADSNTVRPKTCSGTDKVSAISGSGVVTCTTDVTGGGASLPVVDATSIAEGSVDATKEVRFEVDGLTTGTVRVLTMADSNVDLANTDADFVAGDTTDDDDLDVAAGGTGASSFTSNAALVGNGTGDLQASAMTITAGAVDGVTTLDADGAVTGPSFAADPTATPLVELDDDIATDSNSESRINGDAVADDNGRIRLQVEENADGTYYTAVDAKSTAGAVTVELGGNGTANFIQIAEGGVLTGEGTATIEAAALTGTVPDASVNGGNEEDEIDLTDLRDSGTNTCTGGQSVRRNAGDTAFECFTPSSGSANFVEKSLSLSGGSGYFSATVTGATWVTASSVIQCGVLGTTADGLTPEAIAVGDLSVTVSNRVAGTGFDVVVYSPNGLEGTIRAHCVGA